MPNFNTNNPETTDGQEWEPLATGQYLMKIAEAQVAPSPFENEDGGHDDQLKIVWELAEWLPEYENNNYKQGQRVYQQMRPWYGSGKRGDSKFKQFVDGLLAQGLIKPEFYIADADNASNQGDLIGIKQLVMVERYIKGQGKNAGQPGNRVLAVTAPKKNGHTPPPTPSIPRRTAVQPHELKPKSEIVPPREVMEQWITDVEHGTRDELLTAADSIRAYASPYYATMDLSKREDAAIRRMLPAMIEDVFSQEIAF